MWKPGTAKPNSSNNGTSAQPPPTRSNSKSPKSGSGKKLSSSTMGMRFMQRKNNNNNDANKKEQDERKAILTAAAARQNSNNRSRTVTNDLDSSVQNNDNNLPSRKRDSMEIEQEQSASETSDSLIYLELASVTDMHGIGSDLIGRRSFGGFHKSVHTTWESALKRRTDNEARTTNTKHHITDEELLERYEKYVKGRSGSGGKDGSGGGVGGGRGRGRKEKRKRN